MLRKDVLRHAVSLLLVAIAFLSSTSILLGHSASTTAPLPAIPAAAIWYVSPTGNDGNTCQTPGAACATINAAINKAANGDTIEIAAGTYPEHDVQISKQLTLNGAGSTATFVDAGASGRIFEVTSAVTMTNLRLQNGQTPAGSLFVAAGGAVLNGGLANLTLRDVVLINNRAAGSGGAIFNAGQLTLNNTQVVSNTAAEAGGGLYNYNQGVLTITQSSIVSNTAGAFESGGGIFAAGARVSVISTTIAGNIGASFGGGLLVYLNGTATLDSVTLAGNQALNGGALYAAQGVITLTNTTLSSNNASNNYGGIYLSGSPLNLYLINSTIAYNTRTGTAGNGVNGLTISSGATANLVNTILSNNQDNNCFSATPPASQGYNLSDDFSCQLTQSGDKQGLDAQLGALTHNGGAVQTHALLPGSPAIDAGDTARCPAIDARHIARPYDGDGNGVAVCDMGAFEARHSIRIADSTVLEGDSGSSTAVFTVTLAPTGTVPISVTYLTINDTALAGSDYTAISGTLTFNPGELTKTIGVSVTGDLIDEFNETFRVDLFTSAAVDLLDAQAIGAIIDNDGLSELSIADQTITEGNSGSKSMPFVVTLSPASTSSVTVTYATVAGTATPGSDFTAATTR
jgi:parallel beta-helix repeat protein/predicted outer membrane repeat protein